MSNKVAVILGLTFLVLCFTEISLPDVVVAQTATQNNTPSSTIGTNSDANVVNQISPQQNAQNRNEINFPNIYPLNTPIHTPVNTENDFGINLSAAVNTLDSNNVTVFLGLIYQPGRTDDHRARMAKLRSETEVLDTQKQISQAQLQLLQKQIAEAELRLQRMQQSPNSEQPKDQQIAPLPNINNK
jgi:hypothetical protein